MLIEKTLFSIFMQRINNNQLKRLINYLVFPHLVKVRGPNKWFISRRGKSVSRREGLEEKGHFKKAFQKEIHKVT